MVRRGTAGKNGAPRPHPLLFSVGGAPQQVTSSEYSYLGFDSREGTRLGHVKMSTSLGATVLPASLVRHRLNRSGDRRLNRALPTITMARMAHDAGTRDYVTKRTQEGRSYSEIRRSLFALRFRWCPVKDGWAGYRTWATGRRRTGTS